MKIRDKLLLLRSVLNGGIGFQRFQQVNLLSQAGSLCHLFSGKYKPEAQASESAKLIHSHARRACTAQLNGAVQLAIILCVLFAGAARADEPTQYLTRASCASATCHGGLAGQGPAWNSSLRNWEANDGYHSSAGQVLMNEHSKRIVMALARGPVQAGSAPDEVVQGRILKERCVSCHAPSLTSTSPLEDPHQWLIGIREGVGCEACHGPASRWLSQHSLIDPDPSELAASGKLSTKGWLDRTDNCLRCHIGSRIQAGIVRDMNHDLIAAGHPVLMFDMSESQFHLPAHWEVAKAKRFPAEGRHLAIHSTQLPLLEKIPVCELATPSEHYQAKARTLVAVTRLSLERHAASHTGHAPWPELAEFTCYACHQSIDHPLAYDPTKSQGLTWNSFYTQPATFDSNLFPTGNGRIQVGGEEMLAKLSALLKAAEAMQAKEADMVTYLRSAAEQSIMQHSRPDWQLAASWHWSNRLMLLNAGKKHEIGSEAQQAVLSATDALELTSMLDEFGRNLEFNSPAATRPVDLIHVAALGPEDIDFNRLNSLRDQYQSMLARIINRLEESPVAGANR